MCVDPVCGAIKRMKSYEVDWHQNGGHLTGSIGFLSGNFQ